ncbi:hypothetical protein CYMTET_16383 [Cymbomonas tetramitiformis]|uniref:Uncharacterized protein n=1 Tax=Cymbomonas tetramitiformis TaxID=36881 RepID=A0AAE0GC84_9CHLO|nr:hypothetical protein CYMTET_16383 [Cymbomonas tetramitiformis]
MFRLDKGQDANLLTSQALVPLAVARRRRAREARSASDRPGPHEVGANELCSGAGDNLLAPALRAKFFSP